MVHHEGHENAKPVDGGKLRLIASPIVGGKASPDIASVPPIDLETLGYRQGPHLNTPEFQRHEEATYAELFYDLFFAALLTCFSEVHELTSPSRLTSYVGYFCMLWFTWALVGLFDVRYVTDSILERLCKGIHIGIAMAFATVAPNFDPTHQLASTFRTFSLVLMVSRLTLCVQYLSILWHVRKFPNTRLPLFIVIGTHFIAAMIYLGIAWRFRDGTDSRVYVTWYICAIFEMLINIGLSLFWPVLDLTGTHLINRMGLLTLIIIGEGIIVVCNNISTIVTNVDAWTPATIGLVTAATAIIYITFQLYFDWFRSSHLPSGRQLFWCILHFPFHLALTLFMEGAAQFLIWFKITETSEKISGLLVRNLEHLDGQDISTEAFVNFLNSSIDQIFDIYPPIYEPTINDVDTILHEMKEQIPDLYWTDLSNSTLLNSTEYQKMDNAFLQLGDLLSYTIENSLFASFKIDNIHEFNSTPGDPEWEREAFMENEARFTTVLAFSFISAGVVIILMNLIFITSRLKRWSPFNIFRSSLNFLVGIGLCLVALVVKSEERTLDFQGTPWVLPIICLTYFFLLIFNHLPQPRSDFYRPWRWFGKGRSAERSGLLVRPHATMYGPSFAHKQMATMDATTTVYHSGYEHGGGATYHDGVSAISSTPPAHQQQQPQPQQAPVQFSAYSTEGQVQMQPGQHVSYQPQPAQYYHQQSPEQAQYLA